MSNTSSKRIEIPLKIGITGGIGSGKSLICKIFGILGIPVFEADTEAKSIMNYDPGVREFLIKQFGAEIYDVAQNLNRHKLADILFSNKMALQSVNEVVHPLVRNNFQIWCTRQTAPYVLMEAAILFESGSYRLMDRNILIVSPAGIRIERVMQRDGISRESVEARMKNQWPDEDKLKLADEIIYNDGTSSLIKQILNINTILTEYGKIR